MYKISLKSPKKSHKAQNVHVINKTKKVIFVILPQRADTRKVNGSKLV